MNHGRLQRVDGDILCFQKEGDEQQVCCQGYSAIIFATGFERSFKLLRDMLGHLQPDIKNGQSITPGLYIAGIPRENEQTVIISDGTEQAINIVETIMNGLPQRQIVAKPRTKVAKYSL